MYEKLIKYIETADVKRSPAWLPTRPSQAFLVCLGAGPWKFARRQKIQRDALDWLGDGDLVDLAHVMKTNEIFPNRFEKQIYPHCPFPLTWQVLILRRAVENTIHNNRGSVTFDELITTMLQNPDKQNQLTQFYTLCGIFPPKHIKTISLFCRDYLKCPCFPMDRHVKKQLKELELGKLSEVELVEVCKSINQDPCELAFTMVNCKMSIGNPNWTNYQRSIK